MGVAEKQTLGCRSPERHCPEPEPPEPEPEPEPEPLAAAMHRLARARPSRSMLVATRAPELAYYALGGAALTAGDDRPAAQH